MTESTPAADGTADLEAVAALAKIRPFDRMDRADVGWAAARLRPLRLEPGTVVASAGQPAAQLLLLREGAVEVELGGGGQLAELVPGDCLLLEEIQAGRPVLFGYRARTAALLSALAAEDVRALLARSAAFRAFAERRAKKLYSRLQRLQEAMAVSGDSAMMMLGCMRAITAACSRLSAQAIEARPTWSARWMVRSNSSRGSFLSAWLSRTPTAPAALTASGRTEPMPRPTGRESMCWAKTSNFLVPRASSGMSTYCGVKMI